MRKLDFAKARPEIERGITQPEWDCASGMPVSALLEECRRIETEMSGEPRMRVKARMFAFLLDHGQLAKNPYDIFADRLNHGGILGKIRLEWKKQAEDGALKDAMRDTQAGCDAGAWDGIADFSHTAPDWDRLLSLGGPGILCALRDAMAAQAEKGCLTERAQIFYEGCILAWEAILRLLRRMARQARAFPDEPASCMAAEMTEALALRAPRTFPEALKLISVYYMLQNDVEATMLRSLGRLDQHLLRFYRDDLHSGRYTPEELDETLRVFYCRINAMNHPNNLPICLGGGQKGVNELTERMRKVYDDMGLYCPKMQVRVDANTPDDFLKRVMDSICRGNSSYVFVNDAVVTSGLRRLGVSEADAEGYVPVGCYEPMVLGKELPCTCAGTVNLSKMIELAMNDGWDPVAGVQIGPHTGRAETLAQPEDFERAVLDQIGFAVKQTQARIRAYETVLGDLNPSPVFSATMESCVNRGEDAYWGGLVYNNSSINCIGLAGAVDSIMAVRRVVYEEARLSLCQMRDLLRGNWEGAELLRRHIWEHCSKYGNGDADADACAARLCNFCGERINNVPNARGGVFRMGLFSIDWVFGFGKKTGATPDGRLAGEPLSKNLCAVMGMDKSGPTALVHSVTMLDLSRSANGAVLDLLIHPTAVQGEAGRNAMLALLRTFCRRGGQGLQFNVLDAEQLKRAKQNPEKYASLQVRVCGWNAFFVNLSDAEQNMFIRQAEGEESCEAKF